jgi:hypothetical protein
MRLQCLVMGQISAFGCSARRRRGTDRAVLRYGEGSAGGSAAAMRQKGGQAAGFARRLHDRCEI